MKVTTGVSAITSSDSLLAALVMAPYFCQLTIGGPKWECSMSQVFNRFDPRVKQKAANSRNGVVGRIGRGMPIIPSTKEMNPATIHKLRIK